MSTISNYYLDKDYQKAIEANLYLVDKQRNYVPFVMNLPQEDFLGNMTNRNIILKARQQGFSTLILAIMTILFIYSHNETMVIITHDEDAAKELLDRIKTLFLPAWEQKNGIKIPIGKDTESKIKNIANNNEIYITSARAFNIGRGDTITVLHLSEAAYYPDWKKIQDGALQALTEDGLLFIETTANGFNFLSDLWDEAVEGINELTPHFYGANWLYDQKFLDMKKIQLKRLFLQAYPMKPEDAFITTGDPFFDLYEVKKDITRVQKKISIQPEIKNISSQLNEHRHLKQYRTIEKREELIVTQDCAHGGGDYVAIKVFSKTHLDFPITYHNQISSEKLNPWIIRLLNTLADITKIKPIVAYERNNGGNYLMSQVYELNHQGKYTVYTMKRFGKAEENTETKVLGWDTNGSTRPMILAALQDIFEKHVYREYDLLTVKEALSFVINSRGKPEAEKGKHDDLLMATGIALMIHSQGIKNEPLQTKTEHRIQNLPENKLFDDKGWY